MTRPLGEVAVVRGGYPLPAGPPDDAVGEGTADLWRLLQAGDLPSDGHVAWDALRPLRPTRDPKPYAVENGDVVVPLRAARPTALALRGVPPGVLAGGSLALCTVDKRVLLPEYLAWHLTHPVTGLNLDRLTQGSNLRFVPLSALRTIEIALPPLAAQQRIARAAELHAHAAALERSLASARALLVDALTLNALRRPDAQPA